MTNILDTLEHNINLFGYNIPFVDTKNKIAIDILNFNERSEKAIADKKYNINQLETFENNGWRLIQVFEDEIINSPNVVLSRINHILNKSNNIIYARKCKIQKINFKLAKQFINDTHIQRSNSSFSNAYGLIYNDSLCAVMIFSKPRFNKNIDWEIFRYSTNCNTSVVGGASKLFRYFLKEQTPKIVISYADRRYSNGNLYEQLGFTLKEKSYPCYWYFKDPSKKYHRSTFQKHKLKKILEIFDQNKTELENMKLNGWDRIFDSGNYVFIYKNVL